MSPYCLPPLLIRIILRNLRHISFLPEEKEEANKKSHLKTWENYTKTEKRS